MVMRSNETMSADDGCILETNSDSIDGVRVRQTDTGLLHAFVGVADAAITSGNYGLIQVYGYRSTSRVFQTNTSIDTGTPLVPVAGAAYVQSFASSNVPYAVLLETIVSAAASATISKKIFIRAM